MKFEGSKYDNDRGVKEGSKADKARDAKQRAKMKAWDKANAEKNAQIRKKKIPISLPKVSIQNETEDK